MKAILTLTLLLSFGAAALAQNTTTNVKIHTIELSVVLSSVEEAATNFNAIKTTNENSTVRLYKFKNSKIKKALAFTTKRNSAKLA